MIGPLGSSFALLQGATAAEIAALFVPEAPPIDASGSAPPAADAPGRGVAVAPSDVPPPTETLAAGRPLATSLGPSLAGLRLPAAEGDTGWVRSLPLAVAAAPPDVSRLEENRPSTATSARDQGRSTAMIDIPGEGARLAPSSLTPIASREPSLRAAAAPDTDRHDGGPAGLQASARPAPHAGTVNDRSLEPDAGIANTSAPKALEIGPALDLQPAGTAAPETDIPSPVIIGPAPANAVSGPAMPPLGGEAVGEAPRRPADTAEGSTPLFVADAAPHASLGREGMGAGEPPEAWTGAEAASVALAAARPVASAVPPTVDQHGRDFPEPQRPDDPPPIDNAVSMRPAPEERPVGGSLLERSSFSLATANKGERPGPERAAHIDCAGAADIVTSESRFPGMAAHGASMPPPAGVGEASALDHVLVSLAGQDWSGGTGGIIPSTILNAAMIPGWPPPRPFDTPRPEALVGLTAPALRDETTMLNRLADRSGVAFSQQVRDRLKHVSPRQRRRMLAALSAVMDTIDDVLSAIESELLLASRAAHSDDFATAGLRHRLTA